MGTNPASGGGYLNVFCFCVLRLAMYSQFHYFTPLQWLGRQNFQRNSQFYKYNCSFSIFRILFVTPYYRPRPCFNAGHKAIFIPSFDGMQKVVLYFLAHLIEYPECCGSFCVFKSIFKSKTKSLTKFLYVIN